MIAKLDNLDKAVAKQIFTVFQCSYKVEAQLIGVTDFPPLMRTVQDIANSASQFYGFSEGGCLAAVIEIAIKDKVLDINSLTVDPDFFRKGIAGQLLEFVLTSFDSNEIIVETAAVNKPAIDLYKKYGFVEFKRWTPSHGIPKVALSVV